MFPSSTVLNVRKYLFLAFEDQENRNKKEAEYYIYSLAYALQAMENKSENTTKGRHRSQSVPNTEYSDSFETEQKRNNIHEMDDRNSDSVKTNKRFKYHSRNKMIGRIFYWTIRPHKERFSALREIFKSVVNYMKNI